MFHEKGGWGCHREAHAGDLLMLFQVRAHAGDAMICGVHQVAREGR